jgi:hypothetical protein
LACYVIEIGEIQIKLKREKEHLDTSSGGVEIQTCREERDF